MQQTKIVNSFMHHLVLQIIMVIVLYCQIMENESNTGNILKHKLLKVCENVDENFEQKLFFAQQALSFGRRKHNEAKENVI